MRESVSLTWRRIPERYMLIGTKCETCGSIYFPPRKICPKCRRRGKIVEFKLSGKGKIYSFTQISAPPRGFERQAPYVIAIVELDEGPRVIGQIVDVTEKDVSIGDPVKLVFRKIQQNDPEGLIYYGFKFALDKK